MKIINKSHIFLLMFVIIPAFSLLNAYTPDSWQIARGGGYRGGEMPHYGEDNTRAPGEANAAAWSFEKGVEEGSGFIEGGGTVYGVPSSDSDQSLPGNDDSDNLYNSYPK